MKRLKYIFALPILSTAILAAGNPRTTITATLDSAYITMGNVTGLTIEVVEPSNVNSTVGIVPETMPREVEIVGEVSNDTVDLGNNLRQITRKIILQSFDSGVYTLPPVLYQSGSDTLLSNMVSLKVNPVDVSQMDGINPMADTLTVQSRWWDWLPDWITDYWGWLLLALVVIAGGVCAALIITKRVAVPFIPQKKPIPPYELAKQRLTALRSEHLCESGREREYYTRLTDILREYIDRRFGINAMEMTSRQILEQLNANPDTRPSEGLMKEILAMADFVKFAKMRPMPEDNSLIFGKAEQFVENTKPLPEPEAQETNVQPSNSTR